MDPAAPIPAKRPAPLAQAAPPAAPDPLRRKAEELEAAFLSEMLGHAGLGAAGGSLSGNFGGGIGEEQFASFLRDEQARAMVRAGGIGLAERLFHALAAGRDADGR
ncbi:rod-binding protein [Szabonella alba]|uniref:Rod-binding protein n=1 Tax=Szabonella alba TaxID=2804194 RepID=A0A8K0V8C1_9RHOB|nr:rod-binding protein [Szabonella alba]MBL4917006.1 rod-binding protein [Szabonella alba]